ncbi:MAG: histidine kinase [Anaerolineales bacterium]|jgi:signal transduction histidine kinase
MKNYPQSKFLLRFWNFAGAVSVRTKIFGIVLGSTLLLSVGFTIQVRNSLIRVLMAKSREQGVSIARDVAARSTDLILVNDLYSLHQLLAETQKNFPDVRYAFIIDPESHLLAQTFDGGFPPDLLSMNSVDPGSYQNTVVLNTDEGVVWDVAVPIFGGKAGTARVGISDQGVRGTLATVTSQLGLTILVVLLVSLLAATMLTWILTRPILELVDAASDIARGDFSSRVRRWANDELGALADAFNHMAVELGRTDELRLEQERLRKQLLEGVIAAQEEERRRIARELHDSTSQSLTSLIVGLRMLETSNDFDQVCSQSRQLRQTVRQTLDEVHALAVQLRPPVLDDLGLHAALGRYIKELRLRFNIAVDFQVVGFEHRRLPPAIETAVYRILQEALTNAARHANAEHISVLLEERDGLVSGIVEDDGQGFDADEILHAGLEECKLGLHGMQERAQQLGGSVVIESKPGQGTTIYVRIPMEVVGDRENSSLPC